MTIKRANSKTPGVRFFYVTGDSGTEYVVAFVRREGMRRATCNCPDFTYRRQTRHSHRYCKHIAAVRASLRITNSSLRVIEEARLMGRTVEDHIRTRQEDECRLADLENRANCS